MRLLTLLLALTSAVLCAQWTNQDYEIFDVARALEKSEGANATFYSFLNVTHKASTDDISKAYRKRSRELHPDKNPGVKNAQKRFERLGLIVKMLRTPEVRTRYDHFYRNGFPKWKGTGYFYSRYRPGFGSVLILLFFTVSGFHWLGMLIAATSHRARINGHIQDARTAAGYPNITKRKRVTTETGRICSVETNGDVFLIHGSEEILMSPDEVPGASFDRTLFVRVPLIMFRNTVGRLIGSSRLADELDEDTMDANKETIKKIETDTDGQQKVEKVFSSKKVGGVRRRN